MTYNLRDGAGKAPVAQCCEFGSRTRSCHRSILLTRKVSVERPGRYYPWK